MNSKGPPSSFDSERPGETITPRKLDSLGGGLYIDELFDEISGLAIDDREAVLARRCAGHPSVEAEVRALLATVSTDERTSEEPLQGLLIEPGATVGRYRLEQRLGAGATASVWKAFDTHLHSFTALKLLHPDGRIRGSAALEAVMREARAASAIISDHVIRIKTAGRFERGPHYVEMELCAENRPGPNGTEILEIGRTLAETELYSNEEVARVVAEAARGVEAAHRAGVLHRDLKPGNILITPVSRRAKVTDFGLAAEQLYQPPRPETPATATVTVQLEAGDGRIVGTPAYMPPEQAMGKPATRAGDVYALGATLYALLSRKPPYEPSGTNPIGALDVLQQVRARPPRPLHTIARVPRRLARIVEKAMARSTRARYQTAADLAADLELWLENRTTSVDGRAPLLSLSLLVRRNLRLFSTVTVLCAALTVFALATGWLFLVRRELLSDIEGARASLIAAESAEAGAKADAENARKEAAEAQSARDRMLVEKTAAETARAEALTGMTTAEQRAQQAIAQQILAEKARGDAERLRDAMEADRDLAEILKVQALEELKQVRASEEEAIRRADREERERLDAEEKLRAKVIELADEMADHKQDEDRIEELEQALREARGELERLKAQIAAGIPVVPTEPEGPEPSIPEVEDGAP